MPYDGLVCLFSVRNDATDRDIDYDEVEVILISSDVPFFPFTIHIVQDQISDTFRQMILDVNFLFSHETLLSCKNMSNHATRASLPPHLSCFMNLVNQLFLVWYIGSHRKKLWNQTLENFLENANLIFSMLKFSLFL